MAQYHWNCPTQLFSGASELGDIMQSRNLRNLEIVLRILKIQKLLLSLKISWHQ